MKKKLVFCALLLFAIINFAQARDSKEEQAWKASGEVFIKTFNNEAIKMSNIYRNCTPYNSNGVIIYGKSGNTCHYAMGTAIINGKEKPFTDCKAPMSVMRSYADNMVKNLNNNSIDFTYNSSTDLLNQYCKNIQIKTNSMTIN